MFEKMSQKWRKNEAARFIMIFRIFHAFRLFFVLIMFFSCFFAIFVFFRIFMLFRVFSYFSVCRLVVAIAITRLTLRTGLGLLLRISVPIGKKSRENGGI